MFVPIDTNGIYSIQQAVNNLKPQDIKKAQRRNDNRDFYDSLSSSANEFSDNIKNNKDYCRGSDN